ncbi:hypothetical protein D3C71_2245140 [compost metagenome]
MPRSASERIVPSPVTNCSALASDDWIARVVPSPVSGWLVAAAASKAVRFLIVVCSVL